MSRAREDASASFGPDRLALPGDVTFRELAFRLWLHPEVSDRLRQWTHLYKRLGLVLQHLAAHGRTTVIKGCRNENRGWRRSPLGGAKGMQYYLWWAPQGSQAVDQLALPPRAIVVRTVRRHDNHSPLFPGSLDDYLGLSTPEDLGDGESIAGRPWTDAQMDFVQSDRPVRLLLGRPGSGKTTVLWKAVEARQAQRVLYLTWSSALTRCAEERFGTFAPADVEVIPRDFATFVGEICGEDLARQTLAASRARFDAAITTLGHNLPKAWRNRHEALHAELRAVLYGQAIPGEPECVDGNVLARLSDDEYEFRRSDFGGIGPNAAVSLLEIARALPASALEEVFPELVAANRAIKRLGNDLLPDGFDRFDRIVVDEIQDLTLLEATVVVEFCRALARKRGPCPWLLMAGDSGQTVRPTGFDWGPLNDLLSSRLTAPVKFYLEEHLRCPSRIAGVIDRVADRYAEIEKSVRPTKQRRQHGEQHVDAHLIYVQVSSHAEGVGLLQHLANADDVVILSPSNAPLPWVPADLLDSVLTPEEAKGLEYQSVCVLDPGRVLADLQARDKDFGAWELDQLESRTAIDHFRVVVSRATETLVFVDVEPDDTQRRQSLQALGEAAPYSTQDLLDHFTHADASPEERVLVRIDDARTLVDSAPRRAWQRACQAFRLLGCPDLPNGVSDPTVRHEARTVLFATAARRLVDLLPREAADERGDVYETARAAADGSQTGASIEQEAVDALWEWTAYHQGPPFRLLDAALALDGPDASGGWLGPALLPVAQAIRKGLETFVHGAEWAEHFDSPAVEDWLRLTAYGGDLAIKANDLRRAAFETLVRASGLQESHHQRNPLLRTAESVLERIGPDLLRLGRLREAQGRPEDAAKAYAEAGAPDEVLRVWRHQGKWERAVELARGDARADLEWLVDLQQLIDRRPSRQDTRLSERERERLEKLLNTVSQRPARKRRAKG